MENLQIIQPVVFVFFLVYCCVDLNFSCRCVRESALFGTEIHAIPFGFCCCCFNSFYLSHFFSFPFFASSFFGRWYIAAIILCYSSACERARACLCLCVRHVKWYELAFARAHSFDRALTHVALYCFVLNFVAPFIHVLRTKPRMTNVRIRSIRITCAARYVWIQWRTAYMYRHQQTGDSDTENENRFPASLFVR